ncbi:cytoplasmic tRNA 2-thiolation protein 2 [Schaereria dolodes]|nr:cytoplasmic tRNA 2-thiolation protein 2 [Schaereria dolodes]
MVLFYIIDQQLRTQLERTRRTSYDLHVMIVDESGANGRLIPSKAIELLKERYPSQAFTIVSLDEIFDYYDIHDGDGPSSIVFSSKRSASSDSEEANSEKLKKLLSSLPFPTSRADIINIIKTRLIVGFAKRDSYSGIVWGDSTTRLAEKTLSETAKGRGFSLPWQTADGATPFDVSFAFPMRDLLRKEIIAFSGFANPSLTPLIIERSSPSMSVSSRDTTIDDLMSQYFESIEQNYPSIVANVVRTCSKLKASQISENFASCQLCGLPAAQGVNGLYGWGGDQEQPHEITSTEVMDPTRGKVYCYGCARSTNGSKIIGE